MMNMAPLYLRRFECEFSNVVLETVRLSTTRLKLALTHSDEVVRILSHRRQVGAESERNSWTREGRSHGWKCVRLKVLLK